MVCVTLWVILSPGLLKTAADIFWETGRLNTWQSLQELNHSDTLRGHREVTFQASIPQGVPGAKTQLSCCRELHLPAAALRRAREDISCVGMHFMLYISWCSLYWTPEPCEKHSIKMSLHVSAVGQIWKGLRVFRMSALWRETSWEALEWGVEVGGSKPWWHPGVLVWCLGLSVQVSFTPSPMILFRRPLGLMVSRGDACIHSRMSFTRDLSTIKWRASFPPFSLLKEMVVPNSVVPGKGRLSFRVPILMSSHQLAASWCLSLHFPRPQDAVQ